MNRLLADGRRRIRYKYTIQDNQLVSEDHYVGPLHRPGAWDVAGNLSVYGDALLNSLQDNEVLEIFELARTPTDEVENLTAFQTEILNRIDNTRYTIKKRCQKKLIYYLMRRGDAQYALNVKAVYDDLPAGDTAKKNRLDITQGQLNKLVSKVSEFYGAPASAKSGNAIITGLFTSEAEDWGEV